MFKWLKRKSKKLNSKVEFTSIPAEYKEKAWEYQQVAGLLCQDIDVLVTICESDATREEIIWHIKDLQKGKDEIIENKKLRDSRYAAASFLASIPKGCIVSTKIE
jgi:hypothetical protein